MKRFKPMADADHDAFELWYSTTFDGCSKYASKRMRITKFPTDKYGDPIIRRYYRCTYMHRAFCAWVHDKQSP